MTVRIKDIARKAGVSTGTVDRVLHNRGNVSRKVRERVERVMSELGYKRNLIASTLAYNRTIRIAVLIFDPEDPYWHQIKSGIERAQEATLHYGVQITTYFGDQRDPYAFQCAANKILDSRPDAVLFASLFLDEGLAFYQACFKRSIPVVLINTEIPAPKALCYIGQDSYQSGMVAARLIHFAIPNRTTALLVNLDADSPSAQHLMDKERGFRNYFDQHPDHHCQVVTLNFPHYHQPEALLAFLKDTFQEYPNLAGIFVTNSRAYKIVPCLKHLQQDVVLVGFDLINENLDYLRSGEIDFLINQNPVLQGYLGIMNIINHLLRQQEIVPLQYLPLDIVVVENCEYYQKSSYALPVVV